MISTEQMTIRRATPDDIPAIVAVAEATWGPTYLPILTREQVEYMFNQIYTPESLRQQMTELQHTFLLLQASQQPAAFASFSQRSEEPTTYKLNKIYLKPDQHGKGLGRRLIEEVVKQVQAAGGKRLDLNVNRYNDARFFYERCGFRIIREEDVPIGPYFMNDFVMQKVL